MFFRARVRTLLLALFLVQLTPFARGADLVLTYRVLDQSPEGELFRGRLMVKVVNTSGQTMRNVNLQIDTAHWGGFAPLVQIGEMAQAGAAGAIAEFVLGIDPADGEQLLEWTATYTGPADETRIASVAAGRE